MIMGKRQAGILRQYADENCSLSEIAEREGISRQGVRDILTRAERQLREAEEAVGLIRREAKQTELIRAIRGRFKDVPLRDADREPWRHHPAGPRHAARRRPHRGGRYTGHQKADSAF